MSFFSIFLTLRSFIALSLLFSLSLPLCLLWLALNHTMSLFVVSIFRIFLTHHYQIGCGSTSSTNKKPRIFSMCVIMSYRTDSFRYTMCNVDLVHKIKLTIYFCFSFCWFYFLIPLSWLLKHRFISFVVFFHFPSNEKGAR